MSSDAKNCEIKIDNTSACYLTFGKGSKNLVVIPGIGDGLNLVKGMAMQFALDYKVFTEEYKSYAFCRRTDLTKGFTTEDMANDVIRHMDDLGIDKADIIGISQGGMIAQYIAINAPEKVNKLVLAVTVAKSNKILEDTMNGWIEMAKNQDFKGIMVDMSERSYCGDYLESARKQYKLLDSIGKNITYDRFICEAESCLNHNSFDRLKEIKAPTLVIGANLDKVFGVEGSKELAEMIPNSKLHIYEEYSHGVFEQDKDFNSKIFDFLNGI